MNERAKLLHDSPWRGVFHLTGGAGFLSELLGVAGASRTVLEAKVPYAAASLAELLGGQPEQACSGPTARAMAMAALQRALQLAQSAEPSAVGDAEAPSAHPSAVPAPGADHIFGFAATASLATDRAKRGPCRAHVAVQTLAQTSHASIALSGERAAQEKALVEHCWRTLLQALELEMPEQLKAAAKTALPSGEAKGPCTGAVGWQDDQPQADSGARETGKIEQVLAPEPWRSLIGGTRRAILIDRGGGAPFSRPANDTIKGAPPADQQGEPSFPKPGTAGAVATPAEQGSALLFPGAFNPLHEAIGA